MSSYLIHENGMFPPLFGSSWISFISVCSVIEFVPVLAVLSFGGFLLLLFAGGGYWNSFKSNQETSKSKKEHH